MHVQSRYCFATRRPRRGSKQYLSSFPRGPSVLGPWSSVLGSRSSVLRPSSSACCDLPYVLSLSLSLFLSLWQVYYHCSPLHPPRRRDSPRVSGGEGKIGVGSSPFVRPYVRPFVCPFVPSSRIVSSSLVSSRLVSSRLVSSRLVSSRLVSSRLDSSRVTASSAVSQAPSGSIRLPPLRPQLPPPSPVKSNAPTIRAPHHRHHLPTLLSIPARVSSANLPFPLTPAPLPPPPPSPPPSPAAASCQQAESS